MTGLQKISIVGVVILTLILRFWNLSGTPPHLSNDEISIAYDAYSILHTGRDEHNNYLPVSFRSHNTYKAPLYIYLATVTNYFLGNSEISVRLPSAILGCLTVFGIGFFVFLLTSNLNLAIICSSVLSLSPWHVYVSRMALETNVSLFMFLYAIVCFFIYINKKLSFFLILASILFGLSVWAYHTEWILTPAVILGLMVIYRRKIKFNIYFWISLLVFGLVVYPIFANAWQNRNTNARANTEIIIKDPGVEIVIRDKDKNVLTKTLVVVRAIFSNYSNYTSLGYLFFDGLPLLPKEDPYTVGLFLTPFLVFFVWGLFKVKDFFPQDYRLIYFLTIVSPMVPSLTLGGVNMVRNLATIVPYTILITCGLAGLWSFRLAVRYVFCGLTVVSFCYFLVIYFYHFPFQMGENYQYGYRQAADFIKNNYDRYEQIVVDPRFGDVNVYSGVPHLYLSYFTDLDPKKMLRRKETDKGLFFDKYQIRQINWNNEQILPKTLYLVPFDNPPLRVEDRLYTAKEIKLPNYKVEFRLMESK